MKGDKEREALLSEHRLELTGLLHEKARELGPDRVGYLLAVMEPTGYLLAALLQKRSGEPDPDRILHACLFNEDPPPPIALGAVARKPLLEALERHAPPHLQWMVDTLEEERGDRVKHPILRVLVAAAGGADLLEISGPRSLAELIPNLKSRS